MATHESQSLIVEMQAVRSDAFLGWLGGRLHAAFGGSPEPYRLENLGRLWRRVERGFIRVDADELTYPAHVILRFRLERAMIAGDLSGRGPARRLERRAVCCARYHPTERYAGMLTGHPLVRWRVWLFPELHARRNGGRAIDGGRAAAGAGPGRGVRTRRSWAASGVASCSCARRRKPLWLPGNPGASNGRTLDPLAFQTHLRRRYLGAAS